jgi:F0F1-type ATP synthase assembly protein I
MDLQERRDLYNGFGDGLARAFELVVTPAVFGFFGWLLDRWIGTTPIFTLCLTLFTLCYMGLKMWWAYDAAMKGHEHKLVANRRGRA